MSRVQWATWLLMLCAVHRATATMGPAATVSNLDSDQLVQIQLSTDIDGQFSLTAGASNRRLFGSSRLQQGAQLRKLQGTSQDKLDRLLSVVKSGSNADMRPLLEMARAASGPDQVVIVDDSLAARNLRRAGTQVGPRATPAAVLHRRLHDLSIVQACDGISVCPGASA